MVQLWKHSRAAEVLLGLTGVVVFPISALLLGWLYLSTHAGLGRVPFTGQVGILLLVGVLIVGCVATALVHEVIHALAMLLVGLRPRLHFETAPYPLLSLARTDAPYGRGRFVFVTLAPSILLTAAMVLGVAASPFAGWFIVPAAFHVTACKMDIAYSLVALRHPAGTHCRIGENGLELTDPVDYLVP